LEEVVDMLGDFCSNFKLVNEIIMLLSGLVKDGGVFLEWLKNSTVFKENIQKCFDKYSEDPERSVVISECMASLPVEELNLF